MTEPDGRRLLAWREGSWASMQACFIAHMSPADSEQAAHRLAEIQSEVGDGLYPVALPAALAALRLRANGHDDSAALRRLARIGRRLERRAMRLSPSLTLLAGGRRWR
ncbi:MAG: hypothetical protein ACLQNG_11520 [Acidimicrobiales bacterium]